MNERILELAEQARKALATDAMSGGKFDMQAYEEKFALLIVQECIDVMEHYDYYGEWLDERKRIKKHFGVKE